MLGHAFDRGEVGRPPFAWLGVPTGMSDMSVPAMAAATSLPSR